MYMAAVVHFGHGSDWDQEEEEFAYSRASRRKKIYKAEENGKETSVKDDRKPPVSKIPAK